MPYDFGNPDTDTMDGFDAADDVPGTPPPPAAEPPVPGYVPADGDILPGTAEAQAEEDYAAVMAVVDRRMRVANYFRMVLDHDFFQDGTAEAAIATNRIRRFVRDELEVLLGMKAVNAAPPPAGPSQFTEEEVAILREVISRLKKPQAPQLKVLTPAPVQAAPQLKPITAASVVPAPKKPNPPPQAPPPPRQQAPAPAPARPAGVDPRIPEQFRNNPTARVINGKVYIQATTEEGEHLWSHDKKTNKRAPVMKDVTPVARPMGAMPLPMPSIAQSNQIEEGRASENLRMIERLAQRDAGMAKIAGGLLHSLQKEE